MPVLPDVANVARVSLAGTMGGKSWANVLHVRYAGASSLTPANATFIANAVITAWSTNMAPKLNPLTILTKCSVQDLSSVTGAQANIGTGVPGTAAGQAYPNNVAMCVSHKILRRYKGGKPRTYLGGFNSPNTVDSSHWAASWITSMTTSWGGFVTAVQAITTSPITSITLACVHYQAGGVRLTTPTVDDIVTFSIDARVCSQRRRNGKV